MGAIHSGAFILPFQLPTTVTQETFRDPELSWGGDRDSEEGSRLHRYLTSLPRKLCSPSPHRNRWTLTADPLPAFMSPLLSLFMSTPPAQNKNILLSFSLLSHSSWLSFDGRETSGEETKRSVCLCYIFHIILHSKGGGWGGKGDYSQEKINKILKNLVIYTS